MLRHQHSMGAKLFSSLPGLTRVTWVTRFLVRLIASALRANNSPNPSREIKSSSLSDLYVSRVQPHPSSCQRRFRISPSDGGLSVLAIVRRRSLEQSKKVRCSRVLGAYFRTVDATVSSSSWQSTRKFAGHSMETQQYVNLRNQTRKPSCLLPWLRGACGHAFATCDV